jgi:hypothetical protein
MRGPFAEKCREVCAAHDWELLPTGVFVQFSGGRHQLVRLEFFEYEMEELVRFSSTIGSVESLSRERLMTALRVNADLAHGGLAIIDDELCLVDTLLIEGADSQAVAASIEYLAKSADEYERVIYGTDEH